MGGTEHSTNLKIQGSKGIRQWPINSSTSAMMIHKIIPYVDYNKCFKLNQQTNQNKIKKNKVVKLTNKKTFLHNFGDQCNKKPHCPSLSGF